MYLNKKTILVIIPFVDDGGVERLVANIANHSKYENIEVFVFSIMRGNGLGKVYFKNDCFINFSQLINICLKRNKNVILFSALTKANFFATFLRIFFNLKFYPTHNCVVFKKNYFKWVLIKMVYNFINYFSFQFIATSKGSEDNLKEILYDKRKVVNYYNPVLETINYPIISKTINEGVVKFCALGRLSHQKGFDIIINAFNNLKLKGINNFELYIGGSGEELQNLKNLVSKYDLNQNVFFIGFVSNLNIFFTNKDYFLFPSRYEGLGLALIEAMNFGLPVISSNCPSGPSEILLNGEIGILINDFENHHAWSTELSKILTSLPLSYNINYEDSLKRFLTSEYINKIS